MVDNKHKAGFVNIVGNPNVGKSTLMNQLDASPYYGDSKYPRNADCFL